MGNVESLKNLKCRGGFTMNTVITIGRQFGSAGREIGEKVAAYFGIKCYNLKLPTLKMGFAP